MIGTAAKETILEMIRNIKNMITATLRFLPKIVSYI